jgi:sulfur-oxidizing protein SoxY
MLRRTLMTLPAALLLGHAVAPALAAEEGAWPQVKEMLFGDRELLDGSAVIALDAPYRAYDAAIVPLTVEALIPQTPERWIRSVHLVIDENPAPLAGIFHFRPDQGSATFATRVRINAYTPVHVVAETNDGRLWAVEAFVKAAGGCSAPAMKDAEAAMARLGRMKLKPVGGFTPGEVNEAQLLISHPNYTGMQIDQLTRHWIPPDYVRSVKVSFAGEPVLALEGDISISEDPAISFRYVPEKAGPMSVVVEDSEGRRFEQTWELGPTS